MFRRQILVGVSLACGLLTMPPVTASSGEFAVKRQVRKAERECIKQMPLVERPNRPGHIYGNNVRRIYYGKYFVNKYRGVRGPLGS